MSTLKLETTCIREETYEGIYITDGEELYFMTAEQDKWPLNPRENDDNYCTICYVRNRYLGSSKDDNDMDFTNSDDLNDYLAGLNDRRTEFVFVPLYAYVHSGITISTGSFGNPWDSGCFGVAICTKEQVGDEYGDCYLVQAEDENDALLELKRRLDEETDEGAAGYRLCEMVEHKEV